MGPKLHLENRAYGFHPIASPRPLSHTQIKSGQNSVPMDDQQSPASTLLGSFLSSYFRSRRLEDRIRTLCARAVAATDPAELDPILEQLAAALRAHVERIRQVAAMRPMPRERRQIQPW